MSAIMSEPNAVAPCQNENNKYPPGCWRLWRDPRTWWGWGRQDEALEGHGFGWSYCRTRQGLYQIKLKGAHAATRKDTCSGVLPSSSGPTFVSDSPLHRLCQRGSSSAWALCWRAPPSLQRAALCWRRRGRRGREVQSSPCTPGLPRDSAGLIPGLPLPLKKCHQLFPSPWLHLC